jgi:tetratricopeptide (TPR) repeat protein
MTKRTYMVVDPRFDHSFRVPRPDLTVLLGTPNTCNDCHTDETAQWAADAIAEWTGGAELPPHYATIFAAARAGDPQSIPYLGGLATDQEQPAIVRSTAVELLRPFGQAGLSGIQAALADEDVLVRASAARSLEAIEQPAQRLAAIRLLEDESLPVRIETAMVLAAAPIDQLGPEWGAIYARAAQEFLSAQAVNLDMPSTHLNLALFADARGDREEAVREYELALAQDPAFLPARFNLATQLNRMGRNKAAEMVLRRGVELAPDEGELYYSLGLLMAEMERPEDAADELMRAATRLPDRPRVHYNAGLALLGVGRAAEAEAFLTTALELNPRDPDVQHALVLLYARLDDRERALEHARRLRELVPDAPPPAELLERTLRDLEAEGAGGG